MSTWIQILPSEPLVIGATRANTNFLTSNSYIPGRVVRGTWVEWMKIQGKEAEIIDHAEEMRIGNFFPYPSWGELKSAYPFSLSALTCKDFPGFRSEPSSPNHRGHGVLDTLMPQLAYQLLSQGASPALPFDLVCESCGSRLEKISGYYAQCSHRDRTRCIEIHDRYHAQTRVGLSRSRRAAQEGILYTVTAISPFLPEPGSLSEQVKRGYIGQVSGDPALVKDLLEALNHLPLGSLGARGYGKVSAAQAASIDPLPLEERLRIFNKRLLRAQQELLPIFPGHKPLGPPSGRVYFSVDLLSPGLFRQAGAYALKPHLRVQDQTLEPVFWLARPEHAGGWSPAWGLPKPTHLAAQAGSVYVFAWQGPEAELLKSLRSLEETGLGQQRDEGYGQCLICHPIHLEESEL